MQHRLIALIPALFLTLLCIPSASALPDGIVVEEYVDGLLFPISMAMTPDGDLLVNEKLGTVRLVRDGALVEEPVAQVEPVIKNESGLLGIEIMPDWETKREFIVTYTPAAALDEIHVSKFRLEEDGTGTEVADPWLVLPSRADTDRHYGGNVRIHDGHLYVALSDLDYVDLAQELDVLAGSILRYNLDLTIPEDNPFPDSPIYAYGLRNTFDFDISSDGVVWGGENGHHLHDELNRLDRGGNYGFPLVLGYCDNYPVTEPCGEKTADMIEPQIEFKYSVGPTGLMVYEGDLMPEYQGDLFMGGWHSGELHLFEVSDDGMTATLGENFFLPPEGVFASYPGDDRQHLQAFSIVDAIEANDGAILVLFSGANFGKVYRLAPESAVLDPSKVREEATTGRVNLDRQPSCATGGSGGAPLALGALLLLGVAIRRGRRYLGVAAVVVATTGFIPASADALDFDYGGKVGGLATLMSGDNNIFQAPAYGPVVGPSFRLEFLPFVGVHLDALYALKGSKNRYGDTRASLHYLSVPLGIDGILPIGPIALRLSGSIIPSLLLAARSAGEPVDGLQTFDFGVGGGLGADLRSGFGTFTLDARYERSLRNLYDSDATPEGLTTPTSVTNSIYVLAGFLY